MTAGAGAGAKLEGGPALPRGRHRLSEEEVLDSQRRRLLAAMLECVGEHGYAATTVPQVVAAARVSRNSFYALFENKSDCFTALCESLGTELLAQMYELAGEPDWRRRLELGTGVYLGWWQSRPAWARAYLVELPSAGAEAMAGRDAQLQAFEPIFAELGALARRGDRGAAPLSPLVPRLIVYGITELVAAEVRLGRVERLGELQDDLVAYISGALQP
jgi:AcrR family transcriptional regulator